MQQAIANDLIRRLLEQVESNSTEQCPDVLEEPADFFLNEKRWQQERQQFFIDTPQVVGFAGQIAKPGSYLTTEVMGTPIVITRDEAGLVHAFINACGHRGAQVASGCGERRRLNCIFHGWSYTLDGKLAGRPQENAFDPADERLNLRRLPINIDSGLIVVGSRPGISQHTVDHFLDDIAPQIQNYPFDSVIGLETRRIEVDANWKLVVGLSHEAYHFSVLHRKSLAPVMTANAVFDFFGSHSRWGFPLRNIEELAQLPLDQWPVRPPAAFNHTFFPGTVVVVPPVDAQMIRVEPGSSPGKSVVYYSGVCESEASRESSQQAYEFGGDIFSTEDLPAAAQCQKGIGARNTVSFIGRNEPVVQFWHRLWRQNLLDE
ncbi:MAG: aromatic ring-hydroxylating dioxygenase subunit alpha [Pseudomonadales bacterium]